MGLRQSEKTLGCLVLHAEIVSGHVSPSGQRVSRGRISENASDDAFLTAQALLVRWNGCGYSLWGFAHGRAWRACWLHKPHWQFYGSSV